MGENTRQNCTRQNKKKNPGRQQACWGSLFCTNLTQPTGSLDLKSEKIVLQILKDLQKQGHTIIISTHSNIVANSCDSIFDLENYM